MSHGLNVESTFSIFKNIKSLFEKHDVDQMSILDCWFSLYSAKSNGWINFQERFDLDSIENLEINTIEMNEFIHYSRYFYEPL